MTDMDVFNSVEAFLKGMAYFSSPSLRIFAGGNEATIGSGAEIDVSYIQFTPQQMMVPVYNIFTSKPSMMITGNSIVKGAIGFNFSLATYVENFSNPVLNQNMKYTGGHSVYYKEPSKKSNGSIYLPCIRLEFINDVMLRYSKSDDGRSFKSVVPTINIFDVYISGGVITVAPDGSPVQDIYQFIARDSSRIDLVYDYTDSVIQEQEEAADNPDVYYIPKPGYPIPTP